MNPENPSQLPPNTLRQPLLGILFGISALISLCGAIGGTQSLTLSLQDNTPDYYTVINWGPILLALAFGLGWGTLFLIEMVLQRKHRPLVVMLLVVMFLELFAFSFFSLQANMAEPFRALASRGLPFWQSGWMLRLSAFSNETLGLVQQMFFKKSGH